MTDLANIADVNASSGFIGNLLRNLLLNKLKSMSKGTLILAQGNQTVELERGNPTFALKFVIQGSGHVWFSVAKRLPVKLILMVTGTAMIWLVLCAYC